MNKIQKFALANHPMNTDCLIVILDALEKKDLINLDHVLEVILGMKENEMHVEMPEKANLANENGNLCRFKSYDILRNTVEYEYDDIVSLWFKNEADANAFASGCSYYNRDYRYSQSEDYSYQGKKTVVNTGYCSFEEWNYSL